MEITREKKGSVLVVHLAGRLDAGWCDTVQRELDAAVREGEHHIHLDMSRVDYISSAGLAVILGLYKQLHGIKGQLGISEASPFVQSVLKLAGLTSLITVSEPAVAVAPKAETVQTAESTHASYEIHALEGAAMQLRLVGDVSLLQKGAAQKPAGTLRFDENTFAVGIGALGQDSGDCECRFGEFLSASGVAAFQPSDASNRADFTVTAADFVPEGQLLLGLLGQGGFSRLARFEAKKEARSVGLAELAEKALELTSASAVAVVALTETLGLVGATLRRSPTADTNEKRFDFPQIRDWLAFSNEPVFRDSTSLVVGVAARPGSPFDALLRPLGANLLGHFHAAAFPYRPLQKGRVEMTSSIASLFEARSLNAVLHLLTDTREVTGTGESQFLRGAMWIAPATLQP